MKRWIGLAILVVLLSAGVTIVTATLPVGADVDPAAAGSRAPTRPLATAGPPGKVVLSGALTYDFGKMPQMTPGEHTWTVKNEGRGDVVLTKGPSTCSCTIANLAEGERATIKPGEETQIRLTWETRMIDGQFEKSAAVYVANDPNVEELKFVIRGEVRPAIVVFPDPYMNVGVVPNDEARVVPVAVASADRPEMKIESITTSRPELITATSSPLTEEDRSYMKLGPGYKVEVRITPGNDLTSFSEEVFIKTDHPRQAEVVLTVQGKVVGPVTVVPSSVVARNLSSKDGGSAAVSLWVRGEDRTHFEVAEAPENVKVEVRPDDESLVGSDQARGHRYKLTVSVPPGTPPSTIRGEIVLKTDHPRADVVRVPVDLLVLDRN